MRSSGVVPEKPVHQLLVKRVNVVSKQHSVSGNKSFGNSSVESFYLGVHFRTPWVAVEVDNVVLFQKQIEVIVKFAAVVGLKVS